MTHGIVEILKGNAIIQGLVGKDSANDTYKVYPVMAPDKEKPPYIVCRVQSVSVQKCKGSASNEETDTIQVDCYGTSYERVYQLYRSARYVLDNLDSTLSDGTTIHTMFESARDLTAAEMPEIGKRDYYGIISLYEAEVSLGDVT